MERGYIRLWRKTLDSGLLQNGPAWQLFSYYLLKATYKPLTKLINGNVVMLEPGQLISGRRRAAADLGLSEQQIRTAQKLLENMKIVTSRSASKYTVITVVNWHSYQCEQPEANQISNQQPTQTQPKPNHKQEEKNNIKIQEDTSCLCPQRQAEDLEKPAVEEKEPETQDPAAQVTAVTSPACTCPVSEIVGLYHECLPGHPRVRIVSDSRKKTIRARWKMAGERLKSTGRQDDRNARMAWLRTFFGRVSESAFLTGRVHSRDRPPFLADLDFLFSSKGFVGVIEGRYDNREAA